MLILSRKAGQSIVIGGVVEITVAEIRGDQVRIGITAPRCVPVFRREVLESMKTSETLPPQNTEEMLDLFTQNCDGSTGPDAPELRISPPRRTVRRREAG